MSNDLANFLHWWQANGEVPTAYGFFHWMMMIITVLIAVGLCVFFKNVNEKTYRRIMLIGSIVLILLEAYKQIFFLSFNYNETDPSLSNWSYQWYGFPFQFCATPIYVFPLIAFFPNKNKACNFIYQGLLGFTCTYILFGGLSSVIYPNQLFVRMIGINIQALLYHGLMIAFGIYTFVWSRNQINFKWNLKAVCIFGGFIALAMILNCTLGLYVKGIGETLNLFYISPFFDCTLPILDGIYKAVPYPVFLLLYIVPFFTISVILYFIQFGICRLIGFLKNKTKREEKIA